MILLTLSYLKYSSKTFLYYCNSFNAFIFIYVYIIFYSNSTVGPDIKGTEWIQRRFGKGNKKTQILCKFIKHVFLHITKYFFLFHLVKKNIVILFFTWAGKYLLKSTLFSPEMQMIYAWWNASKFSIRITWVFIF